MTRAILIAVMLLPAAAALAETIVLPFHQDRSLRVLRVTCRMNGKPVVLLLDTGASRSLVAADLVGVPRARLPVERHRKGPGIRSAGLLKRVGLEIGGRSWRDRPILAVDLAPFREVYGADVAGILGQDLLSEFDAVEIDYARREVRLRSRSAGSE